MEMSKEETDRAFGTDNKMFEFDLLTTHVDKMKSLFNLDKDEDTFTVYLKTDGVGIKGTSYDATLCHTYESNVDAGAKVVIYKKYLNLLDKENYKVMVCENKVVFRSLDTNTHLTVAVAITDEE
jgi:phosphoglucomutase